MAAERLIDIKEYRSDFPVLQQTMHGKPLAYLDTASSAQKPQCVIDTMRGIEEKGYSNIHRGLYEISQNLTESYESARGKISRFINAGSENEIIFTRNTTEAINLVAQSYARTNLKAGDEVIITAMEHHANIVPWQILRDQIGIEIKVIPFDERGVLDVDFFESLLSDKTKIVSIVHISNALGTINPVKDIVARTKAHNSDIITLVDGSQSIVHGSINVQDIACDFFAFTGHKIYGPTGIGVLYGRYDILESMPPYQGGGDMIEHVSFEKTTYNTAPFKFEAGTPAIVQVIGLGAAIDYLNTIDFKALEEHEATLLTYATNQMQEIKGLTIHGTSPEKAGVLSFTIEGTHPSDIGMILDQCGVAIRTGHHCCMPLMQELNLDATARASIGIYTNKQDIDQFIEGLKKVERLFA